MWFQWRENWILISIHSSNFGNLLQNILEDIGEEFVGKASDDPQLLALFFENIPDDEGTFQLMEQTSEYLEAL